MFSKKETKILNLYTRNYFLIYEQKYKKRDFNTHKSVCDTCPGSYHTISQYLYIYNKIIIYQTKHFNTFLKSYITF